VNNFMILTLPCGEVGSLMIAATRNVLDL